MAFVARWTSHADGFAGSDAACPRSGSGCNMAPGPKALQTHAGAAGDTPPGFASPQKTQGAAEGSTSRRLHVHARSGCCGGGPA